MARRRTRIPVIDPTANVIALAGANDRRQDDLRNMESAHIEKMADLRAQHAKELRVIETERINAIREVDTQNVGRAAEVAAAQADALRGQVEAARIAVADTLSTALEPIQKDIAELRKTQYEQAGQKAAAADPDTIALRALQVWQAQQGGAQTQRVETRGSTQWVIGTAISVAVALISLIGLIILIIVKG